MKIIHVVWAFRNGGIETMLVNTANEQIKIGHQVSILIINDSVDQRLINELNKKIKVLEIKREARSLSLFPIIKTNFFVLKISPDIIHLHSINLKKIFSNYFKSKFVTTIHSTGLDNQNITTKDKIISISKSVSKDIVSSNSDLKPILCYNGVNFSRIQKKHMFKPLKKIICVGRLDVSHKCQTLILQALSSINKETSLNLELHLVGEGPDSLLLQSLIAELNIESNVKILGNKSNKWVLDNLFKYDLFIQASKFEGFGLTALEALGAKLPVLLSDVEGHLEISANGNYATLFKSNDSKDLAQKILMLSDNFACLKRKSEKAYDYVSSNFSIESNVKRLNKIYVL